MGTRPGFGTAKVGFKSRKISKPEIGLNRFRVLPPMGKLQSDPFGWGVFHKTIWGFKGKHPKEPGKTVNRPVRSIEVRNQQTGMVTQEDPLITWINEHKAKAEAIKAAAEAQFGKDKAKDVLQKNEEYNQLVEFIKRYNVEGRVYVNCMFPDGSFGPYKINYRDHKKGIEAKYKELRDKKNIDAFDLDQGVWFTIDHSGEASTPDKVDIYKEEKEAVVDGEKMMVPLLVQAPLTDEQCSTALKECPDLSELGGEVLTYEQMVQLRDSSGDPDEIDVIFGGPVGSKNKTNYALTTEEDECEATVNVTGSMQINNDSPGSTQVNVVEKEVDPAIKARLLAIKAKKETEAKAKAEEEAKKATEAAKASPVDDDDEFLKKFGNMLND